jgi:UDP-N-acetyl-D-mannosaminuronic acid dehydrogenase
MQEGPLRVSMISVLSGRRAYDAPAIAELRAKIDAKSARIVVIGLGYVGIPVAASFAAAGYPVVGLDMNSSRVEALRSGDLPLAGSEPGLEALVRATVNSGALSVTTDEKIVAGDVFVIAVDTPIDGSNRPDPTNLRAACRTVARRLIPPALVVVESTVAPGTIRGIVAREVIGHDATGVFIVHCPERLRPGRLLRNLREMERLIGADDQAVGALAANLYGHIVQAALVNTSWETAEVIKTAENAARDVQIALANQLAVISDHVGVDVRIVRDHINRLWSDEPLILQPGPGVGGYCLPKDPWLMISSLPEEAPRQLIAGARALNDGMAAHVAAIVERALRTSSERSARVGVFGLTYNANSDDIRNAPGARVAGALERRGHQVILHDPYVRPGSGVIAALRGLDVAVFVMAHAEYREIDWAVVSSVVRGRAIVDCWRAFDGDLLRSLGFSYYGLGVSAFRDAD